MDSIVNRIIISANYSELKIVDSIMHEGDFIPCKNGFIVSQTLEANTKKTVGELLQDIDKFMQKANEYKLLIFTKNGTILQFGKNDISLKQSIIDHKKNK